LGAPVKSIHLSTSKDIARTLRAAAFIMRTPSLIHKIQIADVNRTMTLVRGQVQQGLR
jgi:hypothetical protein